MSKRQQQTSIHITWNEHRSVYQVKFTASEDIFHDVVRALKSIDFEHRSYNSATRAWSIAPSQLDALRDIAVRYFDNAQLTQGEVTTNLQTGRTTQQLRLFA